MQRDLKAVADGGLAGGLATLVMSGVMLAAHRSGLMGRLPPEIITEAALDAGGVQAEPAEARGLLATAFHFAFGMGMGGLFGLLRRRLRLPAPAVVQGIVFGSLVWAANYKGWVPALGIMPPPEHDRPGRPLSMVVAHWVYGAVLGLTADRLARS